MKSHIANWFGVAAGTISVFAVIASLLAILLPYRISQFQMAFLRTAMVVELVGPLLGVVLGSAALSGDKRSRRFGYVAIVLSIIAFILAMLASGAHSVSHW
jgi:hypothetical protein